MARRKIKDENEAKRCLRAMDQSGVPPREWARQHGIDGRSLRAWRMNLDRRQRGEASSLQLVELVPTTAAKPAARYRVRCGAFVVELDEYFDDQVVSRLLAVVARC